MFKVHLSKTAMKSLENTTGYLLAESVSWSDKFRTYNVKTLDKKMLHLSPDSITLYQKVEKQGLMLDEMSGKLFINADSMYKDGVNWVRKFDKTWLDQVKEISKDKKARIEIVTEYHEALGKNVHYVHTYVENERIKTIRSFLSTHAVSIADAQLELLCSMGFKYKETVYFDFKKLIRDKQ